MMQIEKLKAEIKRLRKIHEVSDDKDYAQYELDVACGYDMALEDLDNFINSCKQEVKGLDEAAEEYGRNCILYSPEWQTRVDAFKAGAKWDSEQGYLMEYELKGRNTIEGLDMDQLKNLGISFGDKVIVQIRKK